MRALRRIDAMKRTRVEREALEISRVESAITALLEAEQHERLAPHTALLSDEEIATNPFISKHLKTIYKNQKAEYRLFIHSKKMQEQIFNETHKKIEQGSYRCRLDKSRKYPTSEAEKSFSTSEEVKDAVKRILESTLTKEKAEDAYHALHFSGPTGNENEKTDERKKYIETLQDLVAAQTALQEKPPSTKNKKKFITMQELLGEEGVKQYRAALKEEANDPRFVNAVFLNSVNTFIGYRWAKRLILWVTGPSASGKTFSSNKMIKKATQTTLMPKALNEEGEKAKNYVVAIDGTIQREVSQIRSFTSQIAIQFGYCGVKGIDQGIKGKLKGRIFKMARQYQLNMVIPDTLTKYLRLKSLKDNFKALKKFVMGAAGSIQEEFSTYSPQSKGGAPLETTTPAGRGKDNTVQIFMRIKSGEGFSAAKTFKQSVALQGHERAFLSAPIKDYVATLDEDLSVEQKRYSSSGFAAGIRLAALARNIYRRVQKSSLQPAYDIDTVHDLIYITYDPARGRWRECTRKDTQTAHRRRVTNRAFHAWQDEFEELKYLNGRAALGQKASEELEHSHLYTLISEFTSKNRDALIRQGTLKPDTNTALQWLDDWQSDKNGGDRREFKEPVFELYEDGHRIMLETESPEVRLEAPFIPTIDRPAYYHATETGWTIEGERDTQVVIRDTKNNTQQSYLERLDTVALSIARLSRVLRNQKDIGEDLSKKLVALESYTNTLKKQYQKIIEQFESNTPIKNFHQVYLGYLNHIAFALANQIITEPAMQDLAFNVQDPYQLASQLLSAAENYVVDQTTRPIFQTMTNHAGIGHVHQVEFPALPFTESMWLEFNRARPDSLAKPDWYRVMPLSERIFFDDVMKNVRNLDALCQAFPSLSNRHRSIPGVANFSRHVTTLREEGGTEISFSPQYRSSMIVSRDMLKLKGLRPEDKEELIIRETVNNIQRIIEAFLLEKYKDQNINAIPDSELVEIPIFLQTLISPVKIAGCKHPPDHTLYQYKLKAIERLKNEGCVLNLGGQARRIQFFNLLSTNHPLNVARHLVGTGSVLEVRPEVNRENIKQIIKLGEASTDPEVREAAEDLKNLYHLKIRTFDSNQREMHLSALESIIISRLGGLAHGSCVSGKDRKGLQTLYIDAMEIYHHKYGQGTFHKYNDTKENRARFVDIFTELYCSMHQQLHAGQNAPGANGIKTPNRYLPSDIKEAIIKKTQQLDALTTTNRLADNNEYEKNLNEARRKPLSPAQAMGCQNFFDRATGNAGHIQTKYVDLTKSAAPEKTIWDTIQTMATQQAAPEAELTIPPATSPALVRTTTGTHANLYVMRGNTGPIGYAQTQVRGAAKTTTYVVPEALQSEKIWEELFRAVIQPQCPHLNLTAEDTFNSILQQGGFTGQPKDLSRVIKEVVSDLPNASVQKIVRRYQAASQQTMQRDGKNWWPSDELLRLAYEQIKLLRKVKPHSQIILKKSFSEQYVRAATLIAKAENIKLENKTAYCIHSTPEENERFKHFWDQRIDLSHTEEAVVPLRPSRPPS